MVDSNPASEAKREIEPPDKWPELYGSALYAYAIYRVRDSHVAEDLVQEAFMAGVKYLPKFEGRSSIKTWLTRILSNKIMDHFRAQKRKPIHESMDQASGFGFGNEDEDFNAEGFLHKRLQAKKWEGDSVEALEMKEFWQTLMTCLKKLPEDAARMFYMREVEGKDTEEICKEFEVSANHLWVIMHRSRKGLRGCFEKNWVR